jgi:hypothetical protein
MFVQFFLLLVPGIRRVVSGVECNITCLQTAVCRQWLHYVGPLHCWKVWHTREDNNKVLNNFSETSIFFCCCLLPLSLSSTWILRILLCVRILYGHAFVRPLVLLREARALTEGCSRAAMAVRMATELHSITTFLKCSFWNSSCWKVITWYSYMRQHLSASTKSKYKVKLSP